MALADHEIYMIWLIQVGRENATPEKAIASAANVMSMHPEDVTRRLEGILEVLLANLPDGLLDQVLPPVIQERYGVLISPPVTAGGD